MAPRPRLRATLVAGALLAGLFAMHGLSHHGDHAPTASDDHAAMSVSMSVPGSAEVAPEGPPADDSAVLAICLTILLGASLAWLWATRSAGGLRRLRRALMYDPPARPLRRAHAPPERWVLSVCRC